MTRSRPATGPARTGVRARGPGDLAPAQITTSTATSRYGTAVATAWDRLHPRLTHRAAWLGHDGELPVIDGTLIRLQVDHLPGDRTPQPAWLWSSATGAAPAEVDLLWQAFLRRFDLEHTFRLFKQVLGWTAPKIRSPRLPPRAFPRVFLPRALPPGTFPARALKINQLGYINELDGDYLRLGRMDSVNIAALVLRLVVGGTMIAHGWNHAFGGGKLPGTARWFESIGIRPGRVHALFATVTELGAGALLVLGLLTPLAAAAVVGTMVVALVANHARNGFFVFRPGEGYEYVLMITLVSCALGALGAGGWSVDRAVGFGVHGWAGLAIAALAGAGGAALLLATCWRPRPTASPSSPTSAASSTSAS